MKKRTIIFILTIIFLFLSLSNVYAISNEDCLNYFLDVESLIKDVNEEKISFFEIIPILKNGLVEYINKNAKNADGEDPYPDLQLGTWVIDNMPGAENILQNVAQLLAQNFEYKGDNVDFEMFDAEEMLTSYTAFTGLMSDVGIDIEKTFNTEILERMKGNVEKTGELASEETIAGNEEYINQMVEILERDGPLTEEQQRNLNVVYESFATIDPDLGEIRMKLTTLTSNYEKKIYRDINNINSLTSAGKDLKSFKTKYGKKMQINERYYRIVYNLDINIVDKCINMINRQIQRLQYNTQTPEELIEEANKYVEGESPIDPNAIADIIKEIAKVFIAVGTLILFSLSIVLGIKYMVASPEDRGNLKGQLIGFVVSTVVFFGAYTIWDLAYKVISGMFK